MLTGLGPEGPGFEHGSSVRYAQKSSALILQVSMSSFTANESRGNLFIFMSLP